MAEIQYQTELNEQQFAVATAADGPVLVIAAAGTGKTRALTYRVAFLVEEKRIDPSRILLLTFTNKASKEMLERAQKLVGEQVGGLWGGTFHHMANRLLRRHCRILGYEPNFTILDQDDSRSLIKGIVDDCKLKGKDFPKPDVLGGLFSLAANTEAKVVTLAEDRFADHPINVEDIVRVHQKYKEKKRELNAMDFDDLLVNGLRLFQEDDLLLARYQEHFQHILVDEYQDTNAIQFQWVDALAAGQRNVLAVGDDFQSIYSWRGADYRNIMTFSDRYTDAQVYKLEINYRSVPEILEVANACIAGNPDQYQKTLTAIREPYKQPVVARLRDGRDQAQYIIERIYQLRSSGYPLEEMAILYRAHYHAMELQLELTREQIPYVVTSGVRFFEQAHIKDVCTVVRLLVSAGDELAFRRLTGMLPRMGARTAAKVWARIGGKFSVQSAQDIGRIMPLLPAAARDSWRPIAELFMQTLEDDLNEDPGELIFRFVDVFYDKYAVQVFEDYSRRVEDIRELIDFAARYETAESFVEEMALLSNVDTSSAREGRPREGVRLSTVHQAKGLEWDVVFVPWLTDGMFPSSRGDEAEERRLFYVVTTRAKDELYLCMPEVRRSRDGGVMFQLPSRFVSELPDGLLQRRETSLF
jgi:DNA helicase-2/ATP-dependent DNA helicase PcrA